MNKISEMRGMSMDEIRPEYTYIIVDPNRPEQLVLVIRQLLIRKLMSMPMDTPAAG